MRRYKYILFVIVVLMLLSTVNVFAIEITIPQQVKVNYGKITLGEVAKIRGENNNKIEAIKDLELDTAPSPGYSSRLSRELIRLVLKNKGYNLENIKLNIPRVFTVKTKTKVISKDMLVDFAREYIRAQLSYSDSKLKIIITDNNLEEVLIPDSNYNLKIDSNKDIHLGNISLPIVINIKGKEYKRLYILFKISLIQNLYIANEDLKRGTRLKREYFRLKQKEIKRDIRGLITTWDDKYFADRVLSSSLREGDILTKSVLKKPFLIERGDTVQAIIKVGNVEISTMVSASERGKQGDYIRVENLKTKHKFRARIINSQLLKVDGG